MRFEHAPLWVKSNFSFLEGASHPEELVERAHELGLPAVAITDRDGVYGVVRAHVRAEELGVKLLIGSEVTVNQRHRVVLLVQDRIGYANLCRLISKGRLRSEKGRSDVLLSEVLEASPGLFSLVTSEALLSMMKEAFGDRLYALVARHREAEEPAKEDVLRRVAGRLEIATVASTEVLYHSPARQPLHDVVTCIKNGITLANAGTNLRANAEHDLKAVRAMHDLYADDLASIRRSLEIAERCTFSLSELRYRYPAEKRPDGTSESDWLREITYAGAKARYPAGIPDDVQSQIDRELELIHELDYGGYFLTMWEIVQFCRRSNILCQGRGSAANSAVCYVLGITAVDPVRLDLLFERFLSRERAEPPDIDLDIEHDRREEVIQWVYERYGRRHAAMVANVIRYRMKSAVREVGKVLGLPLTALDRLSKLLESRCKRSAQRAEGERRPIAAAERRRAGQYASLGPEAIQQAGIDLEEGPIHRHLVDLSVELLDFPRHLSIHPGGFLLGHDPVDTIVPIENATMEGRTVIQWDKYSVEDLGLFKVDLLGLGALTQIHGCFDLLRAHEGRDLDLASIPPDDPETFEMIAKGDTVGVFQIESRAQMSMLPRLEPKCFYDLVIEVAIVRPGPIQGDMVHPYLRRRSGVESADYPHPALERVLKRTLGVPIFQEQVMKIAILVGGYTPGEADQLRRDMAAWRSSGRIDRHHDVLVSRMIESGISVDFAERIFSQIRGFGEYGFPESHAASFALIAYATAYLRRQHPAAFTASLLNAQPMGFYAPATIVEDAKRHGVEVRPVDVNRSRWDCTLEAGAVRMGLRYVKGLTERDKESFARAPGPYRDVEELMERTRLSSRSVLKLAEAGAFDGFDLERREAIWALKERLGRRKDTLVLRPPEVAMEEARFSPLGEVEEILWDFRTSEHSTRGHPMRGLREALEKDGIPDARALNALPHGAGVRYVGMTICRQQPGTATGVTFYTLEDETGFVNLVVWRRVFEAHSIIARTALLLGVTGKIQSEGGVVHLIADHLWEPELPFDVGGTTTRSFC